MNPVTKIIERLRKRKGKFEIRDNGHIRIKNNDDNPTPDDCPLACLCRADGCQDISNSKTLLFIEHFGLKSEEVYEFYRSADCNYSSMYYNDVLRKRMLRALGL